MQQPELIETGDLRRGLEALLFVASESLSIETLARLTRASPIAVATVLQALSEEYAERGIVVREVAGGYRFASSPAARGAVEDYLRPVRTSLSGPALETVAIVAYHQPVTKAEIEAIRGVNVDGVVATLLDRRLIEEVGRREVAGRPIEYRTTAEFLESFGLRSPADLPALEFEQAEPELPLAAAAAAAKDEPPSKTEN
ncbi:MAG: SMC-Scp complex subunit ScpB [Vulcanimicrobiaceae bacterium]